MGAHEFGSQPVCTGAEKIKTKCRVRRGDNVIKAILRHGQSGAILTFRIDADRDSDVIATVSDTGQARVVFKNLAPGRHVVELIECKLSRKTQCR